MANSESAEGVGTTTRKTPPRVADRPPGAPATSAPRAADERLVDLAYAPIERVLESLETRRTGLTDEEAAARRARIGPNEVAHEKPPTWYAELGRAFANPFNILLFALAAVSGFTGDREAMTIIAVMVVFSTTLRFVQEYRSNKSAQALRALVRTSATVERDDDRPVETTVAHRRELPMHELVPGDIVYLSAGDMVPADVRLIVAKDLYVGQAALTGESLPVEKLDVAARPAVPLTLTEIPTICFMGTSVVSGTSAAVVVATGAGTSFGRMARDLAGRRAETAFDLGVRNVSWLFIRFIAVMVPVVFLINGFTKGDWLEAFLFGLAVAVGLTPEMLPMIVTTTLAKGAVTMARRKTIVKRLNAIQNFGAMDVLCTDKTGTLTQDKVVLIHHVNVVGEEDDFVLALGYLISYYQTGLKNLLDVAVLEHGEIHEELAIDHAYGKVDEIPFDFTRRRMSVVVDHEGRDHQLICKGAAEEILALCTHVRFDEPHLESGTRIVPLEAERRDDARELVADLNEDGFRVVAVAYRQFPPTHGPYSVADEREMVLAGFIGFLDPPKESAAPALRALAEHAVAVKVLTGDNDLVTRKVCHDVGIEAGHIVLGSELRDLDDAALREVAEAHTVFAKLTPEDKVRLVRALKARGHTVGFLGDGINDAGALREADVGISVDSAVDIAKESADLILLEKSLMVLEEGVIEGRRTFGNTIKYVKMTASSNFGNVFSVLVASAFLPFLPMLPIQLLTQNLLYDISQTSIPWDDMDPEYLRTPRQWRANDIARFMAVIGPISSVFDIATFALMWFVFDATSPGRQSLFQSGWFVEGLLSQTLIVHMIRTARIPFVQSRAAWPVLLLTAVIMAVGLLLPFLPWGRALALQPLPVEYFPWLLLMLGGYVALTQLMKRWYLRRFGGWL